MEKKKVIIVTGSCGRIGTNVVNRLAKKYSIIGFDLPKAAQTSNQKELLSVDLSSDESLRLALDKVRKSYGTRICSVIHLAAYYSFKEKHSDKYDLITVKGTEKLLQGLQAFEVEQFLFTSTMLIHAPTKPGILINENSPIAPHWDYPLSKVKTEKLIHEMRGSIPAVLLRIAGVYDDECHSIPISHQIQRIYENKLESRLFSGDPSHGACFVHMTDLVDAIELAVDKRSSLPPELPLLIGEPKTLSYDEMQRTICRALGKKEFTTIRVPKWFAKMGAWIQCHIPFGPEPFIQPWMIDLADDHYELDVKKAKKLLKWEPKHTIDQSLFLMIESLKRDPVSWYKFNGLKLKNHSNSVYFKK